MKSFLLIIVSLFILDHAKAGTLDKQSAGFRYTDNVYLTPEERTSDFYFLLNSRYGFYPNDHLLGLRLDLADYSKTQDNDYVGVTLSSKWQKYFRSSDLNLRLFHRNYFNGNAATTDTSYTHTGLGADLEREWTPNSSMILTGSTGYEMRYFHDFNGRMDHQFMAAIDADFNSNPSITPYTFADMGLILSSQAAYSSLFFDLGAGAKGPISKSLLWLTDVSLRSVSYMNRRIDQTLEITKNRGNTQTVTETDTERTKSITVGGGIKWQIDRSFEFESRINVTNQTSNNPNFAYQNNEIYMSLLYRP